VLLFFLSLFAARPNNKKKRNNFKMK